MEHLGHYIPEEFAICIGQLIFLVQICQACGSYGGTEECTHNFDWEINGVTQFVRMGCRWNGPRIASNGGLGYFHC
jgi:hypothetical protein